MKIPRRIFVTGTDTGVGKTVVTAAICRCIKLSGRTVAAMKPIQTGTNTQEIPDIEFIYRVIDEDYVIDDVCPYRFAEPLSPKLASEISGVNININTILSSFEALDKENEHLIVEGAGGIMAPIKSNYFMSDLISDLGIPVIIVSRPDLGTINHTLLTAEYAKNKGLTVLGIIFNKYPHKRGLPELTNPNEISLISGIPILGIISEITISDTDTDTSLISFLRENSIKYLCSMLGGNFQFKTQSDSLNLVKLISI